MPKEPPTSRQMTRTFVSSSRKWRSTISFIMCGARSERDRRHLVGIDMNLDAEGAADIPADDAHLRLLQPEMAQHDLLHHVRRLRRAVQRELAVGAIELGQDRARLQADAGV